MDWLRERWVLVLVITIASGVAIQVSEPDYGQLQMADGAADFVAELDRVGRAVAATLFDFVFAFGYAILGVIAMRAHGRGSRLAAAAAALVVVGAASDELENGFVLTNILRRDDLTDGWIDAMQVPGTTKWVASLGGMVLLGFAIRNALDRRAQRT